MSQSTRTTPDRAPSRHGAAPHPDVLSVHGPTLETAPGRWITNWAPEDEAFWHGVGRAVARRNLGWSIFTEFLGFVVWQLWSIVVVLLPGAGFALSTGQTFWLISMPALVGATMRFPYTFMVARFGGRNWTIASALLLLLPTIGLAVAVSDPTTPFAVLLAVAALAGLGGGNFASSMANITYFYPAKEKGWALGLNAAGGNLGAAVAQLVVPIAVSVTALVVSGATLPVAGLLWVPLILLAAYGAWRGMDNITTARSDLRGATAALREPHLWVMSLLYIGTFGSFIGFAGTFPKLIADTFPAFSTFSIGGASLTLAFLGALFGSLARPYGGRLADRVGGARMTVVAFAAMAVGALAAVLTLPLRSFWVFLACFLFLFVAAGVGNGATYRMIPAIFTARAGITDAAGHGSAHGVSMQRKAAASLGIISGIGAYGGFVIPQVLSRSAVSTGSYDSAFYGFVAAYVVLMGVTWFFYLRKGSPLTAAGV